MVDYVLSSQYLFNYVKSFIVQEPNILSDHCMINFCLEFHSDTIRGAESEECGFVDGKYNWKSDFKAECVQAFQQQETTEKINVLNQKILNCSRNDDVNSSISDFINLIGDISTPVFRPFIRPNKFLKKRGTRRGMTISVKKKCIILHIS